MLPYINHGWLCPGLVANAVLNKILGFLVRKVNIFYKSLYIYPWVGREARIPEFALQEIAEAPKQREQKRSFHMKQPSQSPSFYVSQNGQLTTYS